MNPLSENWIVKYECLNRDGVMQCCGGKMFPEYPSEADIDQVLHGPVSYTHLTLPTNREV